MKTVLWISLAILTMAVSLGGSYWIKQHIVLVEPVGADSQVAKLIAQANTP